MDENSDNLENPDDNFNSTNNAYLTNCNSTNNTFLTNFNSTNNAFLTNFNSTNNAFLTNCNSTNNTFLTNFNSTNNTFLTNFNSTNNTFLTNCNSTNNTSLVNSSLSYPDLLTFTHESRIEAIFYGVLFLLAAAGNVPVFLTLTKYRHRKSRIDFMILHLTIADLIVTFLMIPLEISWRITVEWIAGDAACRIMLFVRAFGPYLSSMILVCISLDRYMAIVYPLRQNGARRRNKVMLSMAWGFSVVCSIPQSVIFHVERHPLEQQFEQCVSFNFFTAEYQKIVYNIFCVVALYAAPLTVIVFCYSRILCQIRRRSRDTTNSHNPGSSQDTRPATKKRLALRMSDLTQVNRSRSRTLKMTIIIVFAFFFSWTPYVIIDLWYLFDPVSAEALDSRIQSSLFMFAVSNSCINPLVYGSYIFSFKGFLANLCRLPMAETVASRRISSAVVSRTVHGVRSGVQYRVPASPRIVPGEVHLELRHATPVRRPVNRRGHCVVDDEEELSCSRSQCSHCVSRASESSNRETVFTFG